MLILSFWIPNENEGNQIKQVNAERTVRWALGERFVNGVRERSEAQVNERWVLCEHTATVNSLWTMSANRAERAHSERTINARKKGK